MKKIILATTFFLMFICCLCVARNSNAETNAKFKYSMGPRIRAKEFNLRITLRVVRSPAVARIVFNYQNDSDHYYAQISRDEVKIVKVENGGESQLGAAYKSREHGLILQQSDAEEHELVLKRTAYSISVIIDGKMTAAAYDDTLSRGRFGFGSLSDSVALIKLKSQPIGEIYFADDFMRADDGEGEWEVVSGKWKIDSIENASLSSNAFSYIGWPSTPGGRKGAERENVRSYAAAISGHWFWADYSFRAACQPSSYEKSGGFGIYFYYRPEVGQSTGADDSFYLFRWTRSGGDGKIQLVKKLHGREIVLTEREMNCAGGQWYLLRADITDQTMRTYIDGNLVFERHDADLCYGKVGLYAESKTHFDDVLVKSIDGFEEDFSAFSSGRWKFIGGKWEWVSIRAPKGDQHSVLEEVRAALRVNSDGAAKAVSGDVTWQDYTYSADVGDAESGGSPPEYGLYFCYQDEANHYLYKIAGKNCSIIEVSDGASHSLAEARIPQLNSSLAKRRAHRLSVRVDEGYMEASLDGIRVLEAWDADAKRGKIGLYVKNAHPIVFDNVSVVFNEETRAVMTQHEIFSHEESMANWAAAQSDWITDYDTRTGRRVAISWHRANFFGDVELRARMRDCPRKSEVRLVVNGDNVYSDSGYTLALSNNYGPEIALLRKGDPVAHRVLSETIAPRALRLRRQGSFIIGCVNNEAVIGFRDKNPLTGTRIAWSAYKASVDFPDIEVFSDNCRTYDFGESPYDWRTASGVWGVANRWECDPRWSFFSGSSHKLAAIWNKHSFEGDVTLELAAGIKMDSDRGWRYSYASDINVTICADGYDLTSGYSFVFGGWNNRYTRILRKNEVVAEDRNRVIPAGMNIHRQWFYIKVQKKGRYLKFWVDNKLVLMYKDEKPLSGKKLAIWTWDNGLMVARVRVSAQGIGSRELPAADNPLAGKCCYNQEKFASLTEAKRFADDMMLAARGEGNGSRSSAKLLELALADDAPILYSINGPEGAAAAKKVKASAAPKGTLSITSEPAGAEVYLNGNLVGETPIKLGDLELDLHELRLQKEDYIPWKGEADLSDRHTIEIHQVLQSKVEAYYLAAIEKDPNNASYYTELAHFYVVQNEFDKAMGPLIKAIRIVSSGRDSSDYRKRLHQEIEKIYFAQFDYGGKVSAARRNIEEALEKEIKERPTDVESYVLLGELYRKARNADDSVRVLKKALDVAPEDYRVHFALGQAYLELEGRSERAIDHLEKALDLCNDYKVRAQIYRYLRRRRSENRFRRFRKRF